MLGYLLIALCVLSWGLWGVAGKLATKDNHALVVAGFASILAPLYAGIVYFYVRWKCIHIDLSAKPLLWISVSSVMGILGTVFFYMALKRNHSSIVVPLSALFPVITVALSVIFLKENFPAFKWIGLSLIIAGTALITWK